MDRDSLTGTFVNEQQVTAALLSEGDIVAFGNATFRLVGRELQKFTDAGLPAQQTPPSAAASPDGGDDDGETDGTLEIPYAIR